MSFPVIQPSLAAGELSPSLYSRIDLAKWHVGAALLRNMFVESQGGASNRAGTEFIGPCLAGINRLIDFTFSVSQTYGLLFSNMALRFITQGGMLLESAKVITGATQANPGVITAVAHGFSTGNCVFVANVVGMTRLNGRYFLVVVLSADTFSLQDATVSVGTAINSTGFAAYVSGGTVSRIYTIVSPYAAADLALLKYSQSADVMTLTHPSYQTQQLKRLGATNWTFTAVSASAAQAAPTSTGATASTGGGGTTYRYVITAVTTQGVESEPSDAAVETAAQTMSTTATEFVTVNWTGAAGASSYNVYRQIEIPGSAPDADQLFGYVGATAGLAFQDHNILPDFTKTPPIAYDPFASSAYPGCSTYHQARQVFAGASSAPETLNLSKTGDFLNFDYSSPSRQNDGIVANIASRKVNAIKHLLSMQSLLALSGSGAFRIDGGSQSAALTPSSVQATPQAFNGCSDVPPIQIDYDVLYVQAKGSIVRDLAYNFYVNVYTGNDMTVLSSHLFRGHQILEWAWAEEPHKLIWAVREDGHLLTFTRLKEQDVYAWTHSDTDGLYKSLCSISEGNEDAVYFVVQRLVNGHLVQYVERMASRVLNAKPDYVPAVPADLNRAWFADAGLRYPLTYPAAILTPVSTGRSANRLFPVLYTIVGVDNINGGSGYTAPTVIVTDDFNSGSGAQLTATFAGGIITGYVVVDAGMGYIKPTIQISDPTGTGAVAAAILSNDVVMNASGSISVSVGDMVRVNDGWGPVRLVNSAARITVNVQQPLSNIWPAAANAWSCTAPVTVITGADHLEGKNIAVLADGNVVSDGVINPIAVQNGAFPLPIAASSIVYGLPYKAQFKSLYADIPGQQPTAQGRRMSIPAATVRVQDSRGIKVGHNFDEMDEFKDRDFQSMGFPVLPITGDMRVTLGSDWQSNAQVCVEQSNPLPLTILGLIPELSVGDSPG